MLNKQYFNISFLYIFICFCLHILASYFSIGFYSDDEHFQILEPAAYLLGINNNVIEDITGYYWEWRNHIRMRPWFQPYLYYNFIIFLKSIGIDNPFTWIFIIKIISSLFGFVSIVFLFFTFKDDFFKKNNHFNYFLFFSFWFYPFLHSRTSSENLSITLFILSFCILYKQIKFKEIKLNYFIFFIASFLMGLSMVTKFNLVFTTIPFFIWILLFHFNIIKILFYGVSILLALALGLLIDSINWGHYSNTYLQFYRHNLDTTIGRLNAFGTEPWWYFFTETIAQLAPILSLFFVIGIFLFWYKNYTHAITWITIITVFFISIFGHKEIRYIFPVYVFAPFFVIYFFDRFDFKYITKILKILIIISNLIFLILTTFFPANNKVGIYKYIFYNIPENSKIYYIDNNPYLINNMEPQIYTNFLPNINQLKNFKIEEDIWIITNKFDKILNLPKTCNLQYSTYPQFIFELNNNWRRLNLNWYIFYCKK